MLKRRLGCLLFSTVLAGAVTAGELTGTTLDASLGWTPTRCPEPTRLSINIIDVDSYNAAVEEYNDYLIEVRTYRLCVSDEAQKDAETAAQAIAGGVDRIYDQIRAELESARSRLESARESLQ